MKLLLLASDENHMSMKGGCFLHLMKIFKVIILHCDQVTFEDCKWVVGRGGTYICGSASLKEKL